MIRSFCICCGVLIAALGLMAAPDDPQAEKPKPQVIDVKGVIPATRAEVWRALTTNEGVREYLTPATNIELRLGGPMEIYFAPDGPEGERGSEGCVFLSYIPYEMVSFTWNAPPHLKHAREHRTWVVVRMSEHEDGTHVHLLHLGWDEMKQQFPEHADEWDQTRGYFERAWPAVLGAMKMRFERGPRWEEDGTRKW